MTAQPAAAAQTPLELDLIDAWRDRDGFFFERSGEGVAGRGTAAGEELPAGSRQLHRAAAVGARLLAAAGAGDIAVGALPYDGGIPARLWVPERTLRRGPAPGGSSAQPVPSDAGAPRLNARLALREEPAPKAYAAAIAEAVRRIRAGHLDKVVLARSLVVSGVRLDDARRIVERLRWADPDCFTFAAPLEGGSVLVGASPELLVRRRGRAVESHPMGGSCPRSPERSVDGERARRLLASEKDRREHALVVEAVTDALAPHCSELATPGGVEVVSTAGMWHLATRVRGRLRDSAPSALGLAADLHPTPAICGTPREAALQTISELEPQPRGLYSGIVGWVDAAGDGEWAVSLRCAEIGPSGARLHAGAGIVDGSDPLAEVAETRAKFGALLRALEDS